MRSLFVLSLAASFAALAVGTAHAQAGHTYKGFGDGKGPPRSSGTFAPLPGSEPYKPHAAPATPKPPGSTAAETFKPYEPYKPTSIYSPSGSASKPAKPKSLYDR